MKGRHCIGLVGVLLRQSCQLIAQHLEHQPRIHFRIIDMARLQAAVMVMLDQVMIGITRKRERIDPQGVNRRSNNIRQPRPHR